MSPNDPLAYYGPGQCRLSVLQAAIMNAWRCVLNVQDIDTDDEFFAFAADSVVAARMLSVLYNTIGVEIHLSLIFEYPRFRDFCEEVARLQGGETRP